MTNYTYVVNGFARPIKITYEWQFLNVKTYAKFTDWKRLKVFVKMVTNNDPNLYCYVTEYLDGEENDVFYINCEGEII